MSLPFSLRFDMYDHWSGTVVCDDPRKIDQAIYMIRYVQGDGVKMTVDTIHKSHQVDTDALIDVWTYTLTCLKNGEYMGDLVIKIDALIPRGEVGRYHWVSREEQTEMLDTSGIADFLKGIKVV